MSEALTPAVAVPLSERPNTVDPAVSAAAGGAGAIAAGAPPSATPGRTPTADAANAIELLRRRSRTRCARDSSLEGAEDATGTEGTDSGQFNPIGNRRPPGHSTYDGGGTACPPKAIGIRTSGTLTGRASA